MNHNLNNNIAWINGVWGNASELAIPICDRGLTLGDGIFETLLIYKGKVQLLTNHLNRWKRSASILRMASPPSEEWLRPLIDEAIQRLSLNNRNGVLRLNWTRGDNYSRNIKISTDKNEASSHRFWLEINDGEPQFECISTIISRNEMRNANSQISRCKTFAYGQAIQAKSEANIAGYDDALLLSNSGEISCGTTSNLLVKRNNQWLTPPLKSGCLAGVMRQQGLDAGIIKEETINAQPFPKDEWLLINSLSCRAIKKLNNQYLTMNANPKAFWLSLLEIKLL
ncbi:aminotransferase class IV [Prochlorococcus sp. MIT 1307]|uniref:aminotransferase class IV n=1 Tax=Prochlorococcus sp. MIT 1307 TaxID=3096219 RepID=UPI002A75D516|nr:aminotransferase class IV [Prochlorococcus sp. MIT 1307]